GAGARGGGGAPGGGAGAGGASRSRSPRRADTAPLVPAPPRGSGAIPQAPWRGHPLDLDLGGGGKDLLGPLVLRAALGGGQRFRRGQLGPGGAPDARSPVPPVRGPPVGPPPGAGRATPSRTPRPPPNPPTTVHP